MLLADVDFVSIDVFDGLNWSRVTGLLPPACVHITGILNTLEHILRAIIENLRAEISFAAHSV